MGYGIGQGLERGVGMAAPLIVNALTSKAQLDQRERLFGRELAANAGILAGRNMAPTQTSAQTSAPGGATPGELLAGGPSQAAPSARNRPTPSVSPFDTMTPGSSSAGAGPLAGVQDDSFTPMNDEEVYSLYKEAEHERVTTQTKLADEQDVARGWQKTFSQMSNARRTLMGLQNAIKDPSGNAAMVLVPQAQDVNQARQILSSEYMKLMQQYHPLEAEWKLWEGRRNELGIKPEDINSEPGLALHLNRLRQRSRAGSFARPGARSVVPMSPGRR